MNLCEQCNAHVCRRPLCGETPHCDPTNLADTSIWTAHACLVHAGCSVAFDAGTERAQAVIDESWREMEAFTVVLARLGLAKGVRA
jgi:hypothetical protein